MSRQQVLPQKDPEVAAALETDFIQSGVKSARGPVRMRSRGGLGSLIVRCEDGRVVEGSHMLLAVGSIPASGGLGLELPASPSNRPAT